MGFQCRSPELCSRAFCNRCCIPHDYDPGRGAEVSSRLLAGFSGYLQTDGYDGYNAIVKEISLTAVGCMAHARRRFGNAVNGVKASANLYSLIEIAKANGLASYA